MIFYYCFLLLFKPGLYLASLFSSRSRRLVVGQRGVFGKIQQFANTRNSTTQCFWFHCASLGEFEQGRPVIEAMKEKYPSAQIVVTFFSPSGYEVRHNYTGADLVSYLPLDGWRNARRFVQLVRPTAAFFVKYEFWYGYLNALHHQEVPTFSVSTVLLPYATPFRWYGGLHRQALRRITHFFVQDTTTAKLLQNVGIEQVTLTGDTRFDRVSALCHEVEPVALAAEFKGGEAVFVVGSNWPPDTDLLLPFIQQFSDEVKFIIAPHEINEEELTRVEEAVPHKVVRYSQAKHTTVSNYRIMLVDNVGMLTSLYRYGSYAYVGGAFGKGLHNVLEPATFGMPIYFGNQRYRHVHEANALLKAGGAFTVADSQELRDKFIVYHRQETKRQEAAAITNTFVAEHTGATRKIVQHIEKIIP